MPHYDALSDTLQARIRSERGIKEDFPVPIRREASHDRATLWRPAYVRDVEKILHSPYYNRYTDKTQVFSFRENDDISRRSLHVQLVSRIARNIGQVLGLNLDLIEAIALGHDIGHTPFGHAGERLLDELYYSHTGRHFYHNVHSVRVLDGMFHHNLTLPTLDGILCHNGELELKEYRPIPCADFAEFDRKVEACYTEPDAVRHLIPSTLEGCVVRISDIIAYLGKDRQDAVRTRLMKDESEFTEDSRLGRINAELINNIVVNILEHSYGKDAICMDEDAFLALKAAKEENNQRIYQSEDVAKLRDEWLEPRFAALYERFLSELKAGDQNSAVYRYHISFVETRGKFLHAEHYRETEPNQIVADFLAGMTDRYFIALYEHLYPDAPKVRYASYFDE